jgi:hypothetical protein
VSDQSIAYTYPMVSLMQSPMTGTAGATPTLLLDRLRIIGLEQYHAVLTSNGYNTWSDVLSITEDQMSELGFKRGHRRLLQREIASFRNYPFDDDLGSMPSHEGR